MFHLWDRSDNGIGTVPWINYDGIENTLNQTQDYFYKCLQQPRRITSALRLWMDDPAELLYAIIQDFRCWMFFSPNMYDRLSSLFKVSQVLDGHYLQTKTPNLRRLCGQDTDATPSGTLMHIPREILFHILCQVHSLNDYFSIARTSKSLLNIPMNTSILNRALKEMASTPSGCLFWVRPIPEMPRDEENATPLLSAWLTSYAKSHSGELVDPRNERKPVGAAGGNTPSNIDHPEFPA